MKWKISARMCPAVLLLSLCLIRPAWARIITVDDDAAADFNNIQAAIDDAADWDIVEVKPGTYTGPGNYNISFNGKPITVRGTNPDDFEVVAETVIDCNQQGCGFILESSEDTDSVLYGLTITGGSPGITIAGSGARVLACRFTDNGGVMECENSTALIGSCLFSENTTSEGGAIRSYSSTLTVSDCSFNENTGIQRGGAMFNLNSTLIVNNCTFEANRGILTGGALHIENSNAAITNCRFENNTGNYGAATYNYQGRITFLNCKFVGNSSVNAGTVCNYHSNPIFTNCLFSQGTGNVERPKEYGGIVFGLFQSNPILSNCTFVGYSSSMRVFESSKPVINNCIFWSDLLGEEIGSDTALITYSNIRGGYPGEGNINADPCFADEDYGNYRPQPDSPCVNAGDNSAVPPAILTDLMGNPRIYDGSVDMGCYEYAGPVIIYVDANAPGQETGKCWTDAYTDLQPALLEALAGDEIRVAGGVYPPGPLPGFPYPTYISYPTCTTSEDAATYEGDKPPVYPSPKYPNSKFYYFGLKHAVLLSGGYAGAAGADPDERNIRLYETILTGDPNGRNSQGTDLYALINNSYHVVVARHVDETAVIDGFTITEGWNFTPTVSGSMYDPDGFGAGMYIERASPTIRNCTFIRNYAEYGGAVACCNADPIFINCIFTVNYASLGMYSRFVRYYPADGEGGAICSAYSHVMLKNCTIARNFAGDEGGAIAVGPCCKTSGLPPYRPTTFELVNCIVYNNLPSEIDCAPDNAWIVYSNVEGGWAGEGNIDVDPVLTWDGHLMAPSPCIDAGDPNDPAMDGEIDIDHEARIRDGRIDMGADEFLDSDGDGLPDWFELRYFDDPNAANPSADSDDDSWTNLDEYTNCSLPNVSPVNYYVDPITGSGHYDGLAPEWDGQHGPLTNLYDAVLKCRLNHNDNIILARTTHYIPNSYLSYKPGGHLLGKALTIRSTNPADPCVVAATIVTGVPRAFTLVENEGPGTLIEGITIADGNALDPCPGGFCPGGERIQYDEPHGGGILCRFTNPTIRSCVIRNNNAKSYGGGIYVERAKPSIIDCTITNNTSGYRGGGISCGTWETSGGSPMIKGCTITNNSAPGGAAIYCRDAKPTIKNCIIAGNLGDDYGAVYLSDDSDSTVTNCSIVGNSQGGLYHRGDGATITNSIIWANRTSAITDITGGVSVRYSNIEGGFAGPAVVDIDPQFAAPGYWRLNSTPEDPNYDPNDISWVHGDYHLKSEGWRWDPAHQNWTWDDVTSQCVDTGDPTFPLGDEPLSIPLDPTNYWGVNLYINKGAYGGTTEASIPPNDWGMPGDYNNDGVISFVEYAIWADDFVYTYTGRPPNVKADLSELAEFCSQWLGTTWNFSPPQRGASDPDPADGAVNISAYTVLTWQPGADAISHDVYFGTTNPPEFQMNQTAATFDPGPLAYETTYYWRIDERNHIGRVTGAIWSFTTQEEKTRRCFPADTPVWVDGKLVPIVDVVPGQKVGRADGSAEVEWIQEHGVGAYDCYDVVFESGNPIVVVHSHQFLTVSGEWVAVENLSSGSKLQSLNGPMAEVLPVVWTRMLGL
ncbi:MAG: hypothetical protein JXN61_11485 [Sedimentisphaerales bacterium]|nr:hypothetical protein [Sedimentisphaerales bacterium]